MSSVSGVWGEGEMGSKGRRRVVLKGEIRRAEGRESCFEIRKYGREIDPPVTFIIVTPTTLIRKWDKSILLENGMIYIHGMKMCF